MICVTLHYLNGYEIILFLILFIFEKSIYIYIYTTKYDIYLSFHPFICPLDFMFFLIIY